MRVTMSSILLLALAGCDGVATMETAEPLEADASQQALAVGDEEVCDGKCEPLDTMIERSFVVTDPEILERFPLRRVLDQIAGMSGTASTADEMWKQWWSSQRKREAWDAPQHPFCDDNGGQINGFDITCPRAESVLAEFPIESHAPVALFNRFDLAPMDGAHCGEYRIVYALGADERGKAIGEEGGGYGDNPDGRNFIIFEGVLPNPSPDCGLAACLPVAEFWQGLTYVDDVHERADLLEEFYFKGSCDFEPVVTPEHYGFNCRDEGGGYGGGCGQIRTNQFLEKEWNLREFTLEEDCTAPGCEILVQQTTVKQNPHVSLWNKSHPDFWAFESDLVSQMPLNMPVPDGVNLIAAGTSPKFDAGESVATFGGFNFNDYDADSVLEASIAGALLGPPSTVTEFDIEERVTSQSCAGCHEFSNHDKLGHTQGFPDVIWPASLGFVHVDEAGNLSDALNDHFLPHRQKVMWSFLDATCGKACFVDEGVQIVKDEVKESDPKTGEPIITFSVISLEEFERIQDQLPEFDTLSGARVH